MKTLTVQQPIEAPIVTGLTVKEEICSFLNMSEADYLNFQFEQAYNYLNEYLPSIDSTSESTKKWWVEALTKSKGFWSWWVKQWERRECAFLLEKPDAGLNSYYSLMKYEAIHNAEMLCGTTKMYGRITNEAYELMVHNVIKEEVKND